MATIGLDDVHYAKLGPINEEFNLDKQIKHYKGAIKADISVQNASADLYADDGVWESVDEFSKGTLSLEMADIPVSNEFDLLSGTLMNSGRDLYSSAEDVASYYSVGFRARKADGTYRYYWLYKVKFGQPSYTYQTKGDGITYATVTLPGTFYALKRTDSAGKHPWRIRHDELSVGDTTATNWFENVYAPWDTGSNVQPTPDAGVLYELTVESAAGTTVGYTAITWSGYTPGNSTSLKYKVGDTAATVAFDDVLSDGWTAWDGESEIEAANGQVLTLAVVVTANNKARAAGSCTVTAMVDSRHTVK